MQLCLDLILRQIQHLHIALIKVIWIVYILSVLKAISHPESNTSAKMGVSLSKITLCATRNTALRIVHNASTSERKPCQQCTACILHFRHDGAIIVQS